jgi:hypothetical protein
MFLFGLAAHYFPDGHDHDDDGHAHGAKNGNKQAQKGKSPATPAKKGVNSNGDKKTPKKVDHRTEDEVLPNMELFDSLLVAT